MFKNKSTRALSSRNKVKTFVLTGLGFGDEGKGTCTDFIAQTSVDAPLVVRYNGGPQACHNVVLNDGTHHSFSQFGSGTFRFRADTFLSEYMLINPLNMITEADVLRSKGVSDVWDRMHIAGSCRVITPYHIALNRLRELARGSARHGSCGQGVGETMQDWLQAPDEIVYARDLSNPIVLREKLSYWRSQKSEEAKEFGPHEEAQIFSDRNQIRSLVDVYTMFSKLVSIVPDDFIQPILGKRSVIFEGAQGVLLDEDYGFHPYTTWSKTTPVNAMKLLGDYPRNQVEVIGVTRSYMTRHGDGPFLTETGSIDKSIEPYNTLNEWQGWMRCGWMDLVALQYAINVSKEIDSLAITHCDVMSSLICSGYDTGPLLIGAAGDTAHQEYLTNVYTSSIPIYTHMDHIITPVYLADYLGLPFRITSSSPRRLGKRWHVPAAA